MKPPGIKFSLVPPSFPLGTLKSRKSSASISIIIVSLSDNCPSSKPNAVSIAARYLEASSTTRSNSALGAGI